LQDFCKHQNEENGGRAQEASAKVIKLLPGESLDDMLRRTGYDDK